MPKILIVEDQDATRKMLRIEEEHRPALHAVCAVESLDDAWQTDGSAGMSAPESPGNALQGMKNSPCVQKMGDTFKACPLIPTI